MHSLPSDVMLANKHIATEYSHMVLNTKEELYTYTYLHGGVDSGGSDAVGSSNCECWQCRQCWQWRYPKARPVRCGYCRPLPSSAAPIGFLELLRSSHCAAPPLNSARAALSSSSNYPQPLLPGSLLGLPGSA